MTRLQGLHTCALLFSRGRYSLVSLPIYPELALRFCSYWPANPSPQNGTIPDSIANLTALATFQPPRGLHGSIPARMWQVRLLRTCHSDISNNVGLDDFIARFFCERMPYLGPDSGYRQPAESDESVRLKSQLFISCTTKAYCSFACSTLKDTGLTGTLPAALPWGQMRNLHIRGSYFDCPLPQGLISLLASGRLFAGFVCFRSGTYGSISYLICSLLSHSTFLYANGKICDTVPVDTTAASILPVDNGAPIRQAPVLGPFGNDRIQVEFTGRVMLMYAATRRSNGSLYIHRDEFLYLDSQGASVSHQDAQLLNSSGPTPNFWRSSVVGWDPNFALSSNNTKLQVNLTLTQGVVIRFNFDFANPRVSYVLQLPASRVSLTAFAGLIGLG